MSEYVWFSDAMNDPRRLRPFTNEFYGDDDVHDEQASAWGKANLAGESLESDCFPMAIWGSRVRGAKIFGKLPDIIYGYGFYAVSERCANVLRQFDLGGGNLYPVQVLQKDKVTPIGDHKWFCLNFGNVKQAFLPEQSSNIETFNQGRWAMRAAFANADGAVSSSALAGPDIWIDPLVWKSLFLSGPLGDALKKAKCTSGWSLIKCRVVSGGEST
jgi:hypothetical protein